eukprot:scaffold1941_cov263-Pinguiococcus_pyrenoidosus.AAC.26
MITPGPRPRSFFPLFRFRLQSLERKRPPPTAANGRASRDACGFRRGRSCGGVRMGTGPRWCLVLLVWGLATCVSSDDGMTEIVPECTVRQRDQLPPSKCCARTVVEPGDSVAQFAYVTLLGGVGNSYEYRGYLYNIAIMGMALREKGSTADLVAIIIMKPLEEQQELANMKKPTCGAPMTALQPTTEGNPPLHKLTDEDEELLRRHGVKVCICRNEMLPSLYGNGMLPSLSDTQYPSTAELLLMRICSALLHDARRSDTRRSCMAATWTLGPWCSRRPSRSSSRNTRLCSSSTRTSCP